jgi:Leucine-rich repeat (LRR) protein
MKKQLFLVLILAFFSLSNSAQTAVPDNNLETYLETHDANGAVVALGAANSMGNGIANDNLVLTNRINTVISLQVPSLSISDMTGIEDFTALERLSLNNNTVSNLDVSSNFALIELNCSSNLLTALDINSNTALKTLFCETNQIAILDVSSNPALEFLACSFNQITALNVSSNPLLQYLATGNNQLAVLDVSSNPALTTLSCDNNMLTFLDVSINTGLIFLGIQQNSITTLDVSTNSSLVQLYCSFNQLTNLNIANGNNVGITVFNSTGNSMLTCITADASTPPIGLSAWVKDGQQMFSASCPLTYVPDNNLEAYLETHDALGNVVVLGAATSMGNGIANDDYVFTNRVNTVTNLQVPNLSISDMTGIEDFAALAFLGVSDNLLTSLDVSFNSQLIKLSCDSNQITTLDISNNTLLEFLSCGYNQLSNIDVTLNTSLIGLTIDNNLISSIDVSNNIALESLSSSGNQLTSLDVSSNVVLTSLYLQSNQLSYLNIANGNNVNFTIFYSTNNPLLTCITADASTPSIGLSGWFKDSQQMFSASCPLTYVPDDNLEAYLETHDAIGNLVALGAATSMGNGIANDDYVFTNRINTVVRLDVPNLMISDMTGIEDFTAIEILNVNNNQVASINLNSNLNLKEFLISSNVLTVLDVSLNNQLKTLGCDNNQITTLDVSNNTLLEAFSCGFNQIVNLNLASNTVLKYLVIDSNQLSSIDVSNNLALESLSSSGNQLTSLDVSANVVLTSLYLQSNQLSYLNIANGNNVNFTIFYSTNNPLLTCITADASTPSIGLSGWYKDSQQMFSASCPLTYVPDDNLEAYLETHDALGNVVALGAATSMGNGIANDDYVFTNSINIVTSLQVPSLSIADMTGIEDFAALERLSLNNNTVSNLDVSSNFSLIELNCSSNLLTALDINSNTALKTLFCEANQIAILDVFSNPALEFLACSFNQITALDVSSNPLLQNLATGNNQLSVLDLSSNLALTSLSCDNNMLTVLDASINTGLTFLGIQQNSITTLDVSTNSSLVQLYCSYNQLTNLNIANGNNTGLTVFNSTGNPALTCIYADVSIPANGLSNWVKDSQHLFNGDCFTVWTVQTNPTTTTALLAVSGLDADNNGQISLAEAAAYTGTLDLSGTGISNVEGLQAFTGITTLDVSGNGITDLSPLTNSTFTAIAKTTGKTKTIAKTTVMSLEKLVVNNNSFNVIDLNSLTKLKEVNISNNPNLITVSIKNGNNAKITAFDATNTPGLTCILVDDKEASYLLTWIKDTKSLFVADEADCRAKTLSVENGVLDTQITIYPNPVGGFLRLDISTNIQLQKIKVYSIAGKLIKETTESTIDFSNVSKGVYLLKVITDKGIVTKKIMKN